jgi:hypothetical protein
MKRLLNRAAVCLVVCAMTGIAALATTSTREVTFSSPVTVNGTLVAAGTYKIAFDDQTSELTIRNGKKIMATAPARLEKVPGRASSVYSTRTEGTSKVLVSVGMKGGDQVLIIMAGQEKPMLKTGDGGKEQLPLSGLKTPFNLLLLPWKN